MQNKFVRTLVLGSMFLAVFTLASSALASSLTVGNSSTNRASADSYANFTVVDTNNPATATGTLSAFSYYATSTSSFEFVLVNSSNVVQWVSPIITPPALGLNSWLPVTPINVQAGWNLGVHFDATGTIPFDSSGALAAYTPNGNGLPLASSTLTIEGTTNRTYSFSATGETTPVTPILSLPVVTTVIQDGSNTATTSVLVGTLVHDSVTVASSTNASSTPTGTVDFNLYPNLTCTGTSTVQAGVSLVNGMAQSATTTVLAGGLSYLVHYNGQADVYAPVNGVCEPLTAVIAATSTPATSTGSISGTVYNDLNRNGLKNVGEPLLAGWTINLYKGANWWGPNGDNAPFMTKISDANGYYIFSNLPDGIYSIEEINQPHGLSQYTGDYASVTVTNGAAVLNKDFGNVAGKVKPKPKHDRGQIGRAHV